MSCERTPRTASIIALAAATLAACGEPGVESGPGSAAAPRAVPAATAAVAGPNLATRGMQPLAGQEATCSGPREKRFTLHVVEHDVEIGMGLTFNAWTYGGTLPGPTLEVCEGDRVTIEVVNDGTTSHGLDTHAFKIDAGLFGPVAPGSTLVIERVVDTPGVFMYHCASGPVTDLHIKSGLHGAVVVHPREEPLRPARELVVVESAVYGEPDAGGRIPGTDPGRTQRNDPKLVLFNGWTEHQPVDVAAGDRVRIYFVHVGPGVSSVHVIGTILDRVYDGGLVTTGVQTYPVPAGSGAILEFDVPESGTYLLVDHDRLAYLPLGFVLPFRAAATDGDRG